MSEKDPTFLCQLLAALPEDAKPRVLVAGGDGTVAWVLTTLHQFKLKVKKLTVRKMSMVFTSYLNKHQIKIRMSLLLIYWELKVEEALVMRLPLYRRLPKYRINVPVIIDL